LGEWNWDLGFGLMGGCGGRDKEGKVW